MPINQSRLFALDVGGIHGLFSLMTLQQLIATFNPKIALKPSDYFDMICGTSTGGLIATMVGRLHMTVNKCIYTCMSLSDKVFEKKKHPVTFNVQIQGRSDSTELERVVKQILIDRGLTRMYHSKMSFVLASKLEGK